MKRFAWIIVVVVVVTVGAANLVASAAKTKTAGGIVHFYLAGSLGTRTPPIVITGAFADAGKFTEGAPRSKVALSKGSFTVDDSKGAQRENAVFAHLSKFVDPKTCALSTSFHAPARVNGGTKAYKGITGTVTLTVRLAGVFPKLPSGKCDLSGNAQPVGFLSLDQGSGRVSFK